MKKIRLFLLAGAVLFLAACGDNSSKASVKEEQEVAQKQGETYPVNLESSSVNWKAFHKGGFAPRWGNISIKSGDISVADGAITAADFVIDMKTITVDPASVTESDKKYSDLQAHLHSGDFFDSEQFPTAEFKLTQITDLDASAATNAVEGANKTISGNLTLKGKTLNVTFPAKVVVEDGKVSVTSKFTVNRTDWDIKFGTSEADPAEWMISKDIEVGFTVEAAK